MSVAAPATLPASWYADPEIAWLERERIFGRAWLYVGRAEAVAEAGSYLASSAGHVPVVVTRDGEGVLRGFVNVCRHRAHLVASGEGRRETLQCPYHAWTYGLDGCLRRVPRGAREPGLDLAELSLLPVAVGTLGPLVFACAEPDGPPLEEALGDLPETIAANGLDLGTLRFRERLEWQQPVNWKVAIENFLECYHCPVAHPGFSRAIDVSPDAYRLATSSLVASQIGPARAGGPAAQYHVLWAGTAFSVNPGPPNLSVDAYAPLGPERCGGFTDYYFGEDVDERTIAELQAFDRQVGLEDEALIASVQRGLSSGAVPEGRLLGESEVLIAWFQALVADALAQ